MKRVIQAFAGVACTGVILLLALTAYIQYLLPDTFWIEQGEEFCQRTTFFNHKRSDRSGS